MLTPRTVAVAIVSGGCQCRAGRGSDLAEHGSMGGDEPRAHAGDDGAETAGAPGRVLGRPNAHVRRVRPAHERVGARPRVARRAARRPRRGADAQPARIARGHVRMLQGRLLPRAAQQPVHRRRSRVPRRRLGRGRRVDRRRGSGGRPRRGARLRHDRGGRRGRTSRRDARSRRARRGGGRLERRRDRSIATRSRGSSTRRVRPGARRARCSPTAT